MAIEHGVVPPLGRPQPDDLHGSGLHGGGEEEHGHHEKKPVLKKVKEKVKKIKDTIKKKHGHGHGHDTHDGDVHDQDTSEEEDGYEEDDNEEGGDERVEDADVQGGTTKHDAGTGAPAAASAGEHIRDWEKVPLREVMIGALEEDPAAPKSATSGHIRAGEEVGESPVIQSFEAMAISEKPTASSAEKSKENEEQNAAAKEDEEQTMSYAGKLTSATKATAATVYDKMAQAGATVKEKVQGASTTVGGGGGGGEQSYTEKISSTAKDAASTVYNKVAEAGTAVMEKVQQGPQTSESVDASTTKQPSKGVTGYLSTKLKPGEEDRALSEVISDTLRMRKEKVPKDATPVAPTATDSGEGDSGRGVGVMGTIRGAVTSFFGGGRSPRSSPANETERKVAEERKGGDAKQAEGRTQVKEMELDRGVVEGAGAAD